MEFVSLSSHTRENGAGIWNQVDGGDNGFARDRAKIASEIPRVTPDGSFTVNEQYGWTDGTVWWEIPFGWGEYDGASDREPVGRFADGVTALHVIFSNGRCGVRKFQNQVTRDIDSTIRLNGTVVEGEDDP
jgi:hypothetical protein